MAEKGAAPAPMADSPYQPAADGPREYLGPQLGSGEEGPVRLVIHHTSKLRPEVAAIGFDMDAKFIDVSGSDTAYFASFEKLWSEGLGFISIEQDVLPTPALLVAMWRCDHELCAGYYWQGSHPIMPGETEPKPGGADRITHTLACVKFSTVLMSRLPNAMRGEAARTNGVRHFNMLDLSLIGRDGVLAQFGAQVHVHEPAMQHLHSAPWPS
jgi:hypothetical protein